MSYTFNISCCLRCQNRQKVCKGPCACTLDGKDIVAHAKAADCPLGLHRAVEADSVVKVMSLTARLWIELHLWALVADEANSPISEKTEWMEAWALKVPSCGECRQWWATWYAANPLDSNHTFAWTVKAHNAVNVKLRVKVWDVEIARAHYKEMTNG